jgi:hypothetical protein
MTSKWIIQNLFDMGRNFVRERQFIISFFIFLDKDSKTTVTVCTVFILRGQLIQGLSGPHCTVCVPVPVAFC